MKNLLAAAFLISTFLFTSCGKEPIPKDLNDDSLIPYPVSLEATGLSFEINSNTKIATEINELGALAAEMIKRQTGQILQVHNDVTKKEGSINILLDADSDLDKEGYSLDIQTDQITLLGSTTHGLFNGLQTLGQLLPHSTNTEETPVLISSGKITDYPRFGYRGAMLDVARHFFEVEDVKRYIDLISAYKINKLHLHLTDDQGWRIEIKSWPKLTSVGGLTEVGGTKGGFYTQEQYKEIVRYASTKFIEIIPEIDMPGHTNSALVAYPELNCNKQDKNPKPHFGMEVGFSTLCIDNDLTYTFIEDVISELAAMTPGEYIHIGGDESHVTPIKDYIPFINKAQDIVIKHGKKVLGWDEIALARLRKGSVVQYWAEDKNAIKGIGQGAQVLLSPAKKTYLDMQYDSTTHLGLHWAAYIEVDSAYMWDPENLSPFIKDKFILGVESPLWTETVTTMKEIEYMAFPRILGHAEIGWTPRTARKWDDYKIRLAKQAPRLRANEINFYESKLIAWEK